MRRLLLLSVLLAALPAVSEAQAQTARFNEARSVATYFARPGATLADHNGDLAFCSRFVLRPPGPDAPVNRSLVSSLIWSGRVNRYIAGTSAGRIETCMVAKGWQVREVPATELERLQRLSDTELATAIGPWIGASEPPGALLRYFQNEAYRPSLATWVGDPEPPSMPSVSVRAFDAWTATSAAPVPPPLRAVNGIRPVRGAEAPPPPPGMAVILFHVAGASTEVGTGVGFVLDMDETSSDAPPRPIIQGTSGALLRRRSGNWYSFTVPEGRWILGEIGRFSACLGGPSFEVHAGEIVFAGSYDLAGQTIGPDLNIEIARANLSGQAAAAVRPAVFDRNGSSFPCLFFGPPYVLELPNLPFDDSYRSGSRALPTVQ